MISDQNKDELDYSMEPGSTFYLEMYRISSAIKQGFPLFRLTTNYYISPINFAMIRVLPFLNNPKDLDTSYQMNLDF